MPSIRFRLDKPTLTGLAEQVRRDYGPDARIVATQETIVGGLGGLFGRKVVDVTVELPDAAHIDGSHEFDMPTRVGLAALLEDADSQDFGASGDPFSDLLVPSSVAVREPAVSTQGHDFASMLDALRIDVEPVPAGGGGTPARPLAVPDLRRPTWATAPVVVPRTPDAAPLPAEPDVLPIRRAAPQRQAEPDVLAEQIVWATPRPRSRTGRTLPGAPPPQRTRAGDLLLLVGLGDDAVRVANSVRDRMQRGYVCDGGSVEGNTRRRVDDRRGALAARAYGVRSEQPVIVAYGIGSGDLADPRFDGLLSIDSDQAWLVVDATRRPEHTLQWTGALRGRLQVDAIASVRTRSAGTPHPMPELGLPEAWSDLAG
ncbi:MAG TPA: hypothetical protein VGO26_11640 [Amnibacterium sp.]|nr:hypothetical protein [Amnibacterium sp.]